MAKQTWVNGENVDAAAMNAIGLEINTLASEASIFPVEKLDTGFCVPHRLIPHTNVAIVSGRIQLDYFTAPVTANYSSITHYAGSTPTSGTPPTMIKFGVYSVAANGDLTRIAITANDTSEFAAAFDGSTESFTAPCPLVRGNKYAKAVIVITTGTINNMWGVGGVGAGELATAPRLCGQVTGQTDLPASIPVGSVTSAASLFIFSKFTL